VADDIVLDVPRFTLVERERRWRLVREAMAREDVDCLITPANTGHGGDLQAESRYLTHCGSGDDGVACILPARGEVAAIVTGSGRWRCVQDWVTELREAHGDYGRATIEKLREVKLSHRRVAIAGLHASTWAAESAARYGFVRALDEAFPGVEWVDFSDQLHATRMVKSEEEIAFLARSVELVERAIDRIREVARPGATDHVVWAAMIGEICRGGSELPAHALWGSGVRPIPLSRATHGTLHRGHLIVNEIDAAYGGYHALAVQPFAIQDCDPVYRDLHAMHAELWQRCFDELRVGRTIGEIDELWRTSAAEVLPEGSRYTKPGGELVIRGCGLGSDAPLLTAGSRREATLAQPFAPGWAFALQPVLHVEAANRRYSASWGDTIVISESGPRRLGTRPPGLIVTAND
jgi:Xaa-Pro aminopeptidase